jgi:hypothetical protein
MNEPRGVKRIFMILIIAALAACRGEPVPPDSQNTPGGVPAAQTKSDTPAAHGMGQAAPEPTSGVEGTSGPYENVTPPADGSAPTTTLEDTKPVTTTATTTT